MVFHGLLRRVRSPMHPTRAGDRSVIRRVAAAVVIVAAVTGFVAVPRRYVVDGLSMGPGLMPGDVVSTGWFCRWPQLAKPRRFDCWTTTLPDGSVGLKRVIGLPGDTVSIAGGDLAINGNMILKSPRELAQSGSVVVAVESLDSRAWSLPASLILDDAPFAPHEKSRILLPVHDVGFAAEVTVVPAAVAIGAVRVQAEAGPLKIRWRIKAAGRYGVVAGRLDGHAVAVVWPVSDAWAAGTRAVCLPRGAPAAWDVARPWPEHVSSDTNDDNLSPCLAVALTAAEGGATLDRVVTWRDILYRPAADAIDHWSLGERKIFVLGDFPSVSRDSRHFGLLPISSLRHRIR